jgi:hypothetical protein
MRKPTVFCGKRLVFAQKNIKIRGSVLEIVAQKLLTNVVYRSTM